MVAVLLRRRLCDSCCLTVGSVLALLLALLLPLLAPWHLLLPELEPEHQRVILPRMPTNFSIDIIHTKCDGMLPLATITERYTRRNLPVVLRPYSQSAMQRKFTQIREDADNASVEVLRRKIRTRVQPSQARAAGTTLTARVFGGAPLQSKSGGEFYPTLLTSWGEFLRESQGYAARVSVAAELPELLELLQLPSASEHPLASTVGEAYPDAPVLYASHGRSESTPIHFDEEENWLYVIAGTKQVVLYEPHESSRGSLPRHPVYRTTSTVPPHTPEERAQLEQAFPTLKASTPIYIKVSAGDALYIPAFWWHGLIATASQSDGISTSGSGSMLHCKQIDTGRPASTSAEAAAVSAPVMSVAYWAQPCEGKFKAVP